MQQQNAFTTFRLVHIVLLSGMAAFNIASVIILKEGMFSPVIDETVQRTMQAVCIVLSTVCLVAGFQLFKKKMLAARNNPEAGEKRMAMYRAACILWWAMIEGPGLAATMGFLLSGNYAFFALGLFHLLVMLVFTPRKSNIIVLLNLNSKEVARLEGKATS